MLPSYIVLTGCQDRSDWGIAFVDKANHEREFDTQAVRPEPFGYAQDMLGRRKRPGIQDSVGGRVNRDFFSSLTKVSHF
jgi:hypothetical protein